MKITKDHVMTGLIAVLGIVATILLVTIFSTKEKSSDTYKAEIALRDTLLNYKDREIALKNIELIEKDSNIAIQYRIIDAIDKKYRGNQQTEKRILNEYNKIPAAVRNLDKDAIRREVANFKNRP